MKRANTSWNRNRLLNTLRKYEIGDARNLFDLEVLTDFYLLTDILCFVELVRERTTRSIMFCYLFTLSVELCKGHCTSCTLTRDRGNPLQRNRPM